MHLEVLTPTLYIVVLTIGVIRDKQLSLIAEVKMIMFPRQSYDHCELSLFVTPLCGDMINLYQGLRK